MPNKAPRKSTVTQQRVPSWTAPTRPTGGTSWPSAVEHSHPAACATLNCPAGPGPHGPSARPLGPTAGSAAGCPPCHGEFAVVFRWWARSGPLL